MTERTWERYGAASGIAFGILLVLSIFIAPAPPHIDASAAKIANYYAAHRHAVLAAGVFGAFGTIAAVMFISHLRHVYDRVEDGIEGLSTLVYAAGLSTVAASLFFGIVGTVLAFMTVQPGGLSDAGLTRALYDVGYVGSGLTYMLLALFLAANAVAMVRGEAANRALGWFAALVAVFSLAGGIGALTVSSYSAGWTAIGYVGVLGLAAWDIATGATMMRHPEVEAMASHRSAIAAAH
jgi:hypothetical protein